MMDEALRITNSLVQRLRVALLRLPIPRGHLTLDGQVTSSAFYCSNLTNPNVPKPIILTLVAYYLPGYKSGGPVRTISNLVQRLGDEFRFRIVTADRDSGDIQPYPNVQVNAWNRVGPAEVYYMSPAARNIGGVVSLIRKTPHDLLYLNSFFRPTFTLFPLVARRFRLVPRHQVVLAPRGELSAGAVNLKRRRKQVYIGLVHSLDLCRDIVWQASSQHEVQDIQRELGVLARDVIVAPDLPEPIPERSRMPRRTADGPLRVVFLSRIARKKNLDFALRVLERVRAPVEFNIYGEVFDHDYWTDCKKVIERMPDHVDVEHHGPIEHRRVYDTLACHDLFFLPTLGENYGHAIVEALTAGVPALISDQTPWQDLDAKGAGWVRPLDDVDTYVEVIEEYAESSEAVRNERSAKARAYGTEVAEDEERVEQNRTLFHEALRMQPSS